MKQLATIICAVILVLLVSASMVAPQTAKLEFTVSDINDYYLSTDNDLGSTFIFNVTLEVYNPTQVPKNYTHPDTCLFKVKLEYEGNDAWDNYYPFACGEALVTVSYDPGKTNTTAVGGIRFEDTTLTVLPDGQYQIALDQVAWQEEYEDFDLHFRVINGEIEIFEKDEGPFGLHAPALISISVTAVAIVISKRKLTARKGS